MRINHLAFVLIQFSGNGKSWASADSFLIFPLTFHMFIPFLLRRMLMLRSFIECWGIKLEIPVRVVEWSVWFYAWNFLPLFIAFYLKAFRYFFFFSCQMVIPIFCFFSCHLKFFFFDHIKWKVILLLDGRIKCT